MQHSQKKFKLANPPLTRKLSCQKHYPEPSLLEEVRERGAMSHRLTVATILVPTAVHSGYHIDYLGHFLHYDVEQSLSVNLQW